jgi:hypothetical protein
VVLVLADAVGRLQTEPLAFQVQAFARDAEGPRRIVGGSIAKWLVHRPNAGRFRDRTTQLLWWSRSARRIISRSTFDTVGSSFSLSGTTIC